MEPILTIARKHNLYVIEDTAQALGAEYTFSDGTKKKAGTMGDIGTTSFFPSKNLGCFGDGGALFTNNDELAIRCRMIANHGQSKQYHYEIVGMNSRLDSIQAAILKVKLKYLDAYISARNKAAAFYNQAFSKNLKIKIPARAKNSSHIFHQYTLILNGVNRDELKQKLASKEIPTMIYYPMPLHSQKAYSNYVSEGKKYPITEKLCASVISLPMHTELDEETLSYIAEHIMKFVI
jgi:dTDP-4-amino-4,6-dideoxygalactose transaminase